MTGRRFLTRLVDGAIVGAAPVYLSPLFDNSGKQQGRLDMAAGTVVINK